MRTISLIPFLLIYCYAQLQTSWYRHAWCSYSTWRQSRYLQHWKYLNSVFAYSIVNVRVYRANGWSAVEDRHGHNTLHVFFPIPYNSVADQVGYLMLWVFPISAGFRHELHFLGIGCCTNRRWRDKSAYLTFIIPERNGRVQWGSDFSKQDDSCEGVHFPIVYMVHCARTVWKLVVVYRSLYRRDSIPSSKDDECSF